VSAADKLTTYSSVFTIILCVIAAASAFAALILASLPDAMTTLPSPAGTFLDSRFVSIRKYHIFALAYNNRLIVNLDFLPCSLQAKSLLMPF